MKKIEELKLTNRETEVLKLILKGYSNQKISKALAVSISTVKAHIAHIFTKLKVKNRIDLVIFMYNNIEDFNK